MKKIVELRNPPGNLEHSLMLAERVIRRADKHKRNQPLNKRMTPDAYQVWLQNHRADA